MSDSIKERKRAAQLLCNKNMERGAQTYIARSLLSRIKNPANGEWRRGKPFEKDSFESDGKAEGVKRLLI